MAHKFEPGQIALVEAGCWANRKVALRLDEGWAHVNGVNVDGDGIVTPVRPLAVIDPEDREQVERLADAFHATGPATYADRMQAALREFANPSPPEPEEPPFGAIVEDTDGVQWIRASQVGADDQHWWSDRLGWSSWASLCDDDLRTVREGLS